MFGPSKPIHAATTIARTFPGVLPISFSSRLPRTGRRTPERISGTWGAPWSLPQLPSLVVAVLARRESLFSWALEGAPSSGSGGSAGPYDPLPRAKANTPPYWTAPPPLSRPWAPDDLPGIGALLGKGLCTFLCRGRAQGGGRDGDASRFHYHGGVKIRPPCPPLG